MRTSIKEHEVKVQGLFRLAFGSNNCTLHPNLWLVRQEGGKREGAEQGAQDKESDQ